MLQGEPQSRTSFFQWWLAFAPPGPGAGVALTGAWSPAKHEDLAEHIMLSTRPQISRKGLFRGSHSHLVDSTQGLLHSACEHIRLHNTIYEQQDCLPCAMATATIVMATKGSQLRAIAAQPAQVEHDTSALMAGRCVTNRVVYDNNLHQCLAGE